MNETESVAIAPDAVDAMIAHARREAPNECCGLLVGSPARIEESVATRNLALSRSRFRIDPSEHIAINRTLRGSPREVIGVYHSHPHSPAVPSPADIAEAFYSEFIHVIVSLADPLHPDVRGYRIRGGQVTLVALFSEETR
jgi:proteasome lid subunit RPN8/RPN11